MHKKARPDPAISRKSPFTFKTEIIKNVKVDRPYFTNPNYREAGMTVSMIDNGHFLTRNVINDTGRPSIVIQE